MEPQNLLPIRILRDFVERIEKLGIAYMLTGSMAMMHYSVYRFTADIDVVLELEDRDAQRIISAFEPDYYVPHGSVRRGILTGRMFNVIHQDTAFKIDFVMRKTDPFQKNAFERRTRTEFYSGEIWIIAQDDLILSKLWWAKDSHSEKQLTDVKNLLRNETDKSYIEEWARELDVYNLLEQCRSEISQ